MDNIFAFKWDKLERKAGLFWRNRSKKLKMLERELAVDVGLRGDYDRTNKTAARSMAKPNNMVRRPMRGARRRISFSTTTKSEVGLRLRDRAFGAINVS